MVKCTLIKNVGSFYGRFNDCAHIIREACYLKTCDNSPGSDTGNLQSKKLMKKS